MKLEPFLNTTTHSSQLSLIVRYKGTLQRENQFAANAASKALKDVG